MIAAAEQAQFDVMITADQNIRYQQNLEGRRLALVVLSTNHWNIIRPRMASVVAAVKATVPGSYAEVSFPRPCLRRRL